MAPLHNVQNIQSLRIIYNDEISELLNNFAKEHQFDDRKKFKSEWNEWVKKEDVNEKIKEEINRLENLGMEGDIMDKMFKSVKYYYCKKIQNKIKPSSKVKPQIKLYTTLSPMILKTMDEHINNFINKELENENEENNNEEIRTKKPKKVISPANAYDSFCNENRDALLEEIKEYRKRVLLEQKVQKIVNSDTEIIDDRLNPDILSEKIKKTYKNRLYLVIKGK
jgi:hypothetical protein